MPKPIPSEIVWDFKRVRNAIYKVSRGKNSFERKQLLEEACKVAHDITEKWKQKTKDTGQTGIGPDYNWEDRAEFDAIETWVMAGSMLKEGEMIPYDQLSDEHRANIIAMLEREEVIHLFPNLTVDKQP